jgi:hypothetical protein
MSRFREEYALVPNGARVTALVIYLAFLILMASIWLAPLLFGRERPQLALWAWFLLTAATGLLMAAFILLLGYVWADAKRRGMNHVLWTLLAIFIPNAIGLILYFILRSPIQVTCPSCGTPVGKDLAFCSSCGTTVRRSCPQCRRPVKDGWTHCGFCGTALRGTGSA